MKLLLVDGHYYAYRSYYAIRNLSNSRGEPTNALFGIAKALKRMIVDLQPDFTAVVMDGGLPAHRMECQPEYKANRSETPPLLSQQFPRIEELVEALGFAYVRVEGEEADDILASYATAARARGIETILATNDKDLMQVVGDPGPVRIYQPSSIGFELIDVPGVEAKWGVNPNQIGDLLALTGDAVDNIPGVPGVGPKTAAKWIQEFGSLAGLLANLDKVSSDRFRQVLEASRAQIASNQVMVHLRTELPLPRPIEELTYRPNLEKQAELLARFEFKTMLAEAQAALAKTKQVPAMQQGELL